MSLGRALLCCVSASWFALFGCGTGLREPQTARATPPEGKTPSTHAFACRGDDRPAQRPLRRLSRDQLQHTLEDLVAMSLPPPMAKAVQRELAPSLSAFPPDLVSKDAPFSSMDQTVSEQHVQLLVQLAARASELLTRDDARVAALLGCAPGRASAACLDAFVARFGRLCFRRPLSPAERAHFRAGPSSKGTDIKALRELITQLLAAPQFYYQVEQVSAPSASEPGLARLSGFSLASQLSYHLWQTMPDDELLRAAESGQLDTQEGLAQTVDRMLADPRAQRTLRSFVSEWLGLSSLRPLDGLVGDPVFDAFADRDLPTPDLRQAMLDDVLDSFSFHVAEHGTYADWLASPFSFARSPELAGIYGVPVWAGQGSPPRFAPGTRAGLLTRAALLATGTANTRPIMKGVFIRKRLLCDELPPPPPNASNVPPPLSPELTTRQVVEALTQQPGSSCASCHAYQINPLGFATEDYDALGRKRTEQRLFNADGAVVARRPVDTQSVPRVEPYDPRVAHGAAELLEQILRSGKGEACFARQYFRYTWGRTEDPARDGCALEAIRTSLSQPDGLQRALRAPVLRPSFVERRLNAAQ